ncbi:MAG: hypothetical protein V3T88_03610 [Nitrosomonadaceae bacterium]
MATEIDSYKPSPAVWNSLTGDTSWRYQTFTASQSYDCLTIDLWMYQVTNPNGDVTLSIRAVDGQATPQPTGADLASATLAASSLSASPGALATFTFSSAFSFVSGTRYAILVRVPTQSTGTVYWKIDASGSLANGNAGNSGDAGVNWNDNGAQDNYFVTYGAAFGSGSAPVDKTYSRQLITFANNEVWREAVAGTMSEVTDARGDIDTTVPLTAQEAFQKVFIVNGTNFKVLDLVNTKIATANVGTNAPDFGTTLTGGSSGAKMIVDYITATSSACTIYGKRTTTATFTSGEVVTGTNPSASPYGSAVSFTMTAVAEVSNPHWYDWTVFGADATNYGALPDKAYHVCRYRGRVCIQVDPNLPHQWYQSRQKNPFDFLYVAGDAQSPVAGNDADCGEVGDIIKVAIPYHDDYLIYGAANELWYLSGDAAFGGELNILDENSGILGDRAWCWDNNKRLYMLCTSGLLRVPVGFQSIENLTNELWPNWVKDLAFDSSLHRIVLAFNPEDKGIHIFKTILATGISTAWWYDLRTEGLFSDAIPDSMGVYCAQYYQTESPSYRKLLLGCADGYIRFLDPSTNNDDSTAIDSYVGFAPLSLSTHPRKDGKLTNIDIVTGGGASGGGQTDSDDVYCEIHVARTAAKIIEKLDGSETPKLTKTFTSPGWQRDNMDRRSVRGQWGGIKVGNNTAGESWSIERLIIDTKEVGRSL